MIKEIYTDMQGDYYILVTQDEFTKQQISNRETNTEDRRLVVACSDDDNAAAYKIEDNLGKIHMVSYTLANKFNFNRAGLPEIVFPKPNIFNCDDEAKKELIISIYYQYDDFVNGKNDAFCLSNDFLLARDYLGRERAMKITKSIVDSLNEKDDLDGRQL